MITIDQLSDLRALDEPLHLAMGVFDGVHLGHQAVIQEVIDGAKQSGGLTGVLTFEPHPVSVVAPDRAPRRILASIDHKKRVLAEHGVRLLVLLNFDEEMALMEPEDFVEKLFNSCGDLRQLAIGEDWRFGKARRGDVNLLRWLAGPLGVQVDAVSAVELDGQRISSTRIREAIRRGDFHAAKAMLGRDYTVLGTVVRGRQLGREMGFPTANLSVRNEELPPNGVYAVEAKLGHKTLKGVGNLGIRPSIENGGRRLLEVHVFDFQGDLYDRELEVRFVEFLRPEQAFESLDQLRQQIAQDAQVARRILDITVAK